MQLSTQETLWLIVILIYIAGMCVSVAMKPPVLGRGRLFWALAIGAVLVALAFDHQRFEMLMTEDGPAEWATFYAFLFAGGTFARRAWQQHASARWVQPFVLSLLALFSWRGVVPLWVPIAPAVVAGIFLATSSRAAPRYDPIGKYYGAGLYVVVGILLWGVGPVARTALSVVILVASAAVLVSRWIARPKSTTKPSN